MKRYLLLGTIKGYSSEDVYDLSDPETASKFERHRKFVYNDPVVLMARNGRDVIDVRSDEFRPSFLRYGREQNWEVKPVNKTDQPQ